MFNKPVTLFVKKYCIKNKPLLNISCPNLQICCIESSETLQNMIKEFSYKQEIIPLVIIIGNYIYNKNNHTIPTTSIVAQLKKRKKTLVLIMTTEIEDDDIDNLIFKHESINGKIPLLQTLNNLIDNKKFLEAINYKNIKLIKKLINNNLSNKILSKT